MSKHRATQSHPYRAAAVIAAALAAPLALTAPAYAHGTSGLSWEQGLEQCGYAGVPDAPAGNNLEIPFTCYVGGDLFAVRPWDNQWITYTEYTFTGSDGTEYWKVVAVTNDGKAILSPVGQGLNVKDGWRTTDIDPKRAEYVVPMHKG